MGFRCEMALKLVQHQRVVACDMAVDGIRYVPKTGFAEPRTQHLDYATDRHSRHQTVPDVVQKLLVADILIGAASQSLQQLEGQSIAEKAAFAGIDDRQELPVE